MSPITYQQQYWELQVAVVQDEKVVRWQPVVLNNYVLIVGQTEAGALIWDSDHPNNQAAHDAMLGKLWEHFGRTNNKGATLTTHVKAADGSRDHTEFTTWNEVWFHAQKAFMGKGSPEEAQITLQLADRFGLLKGGDLQAYCDKYLGLDCNGFVGNYLAHGKPEKAWDADPPGAGYLANTDIANIVSRTCAKPSVKTADEIVSANSYVMAMTDSAGRVIARFGPNGSVGHIFITLPGYKSEAVYPFDGKFPYEKRAKVPTLWAAESTGGIGLTLNKCQIVSGTADGVFMVKRYSHPLMAPLPFRAFRVL
ncbi:MAG TPA: hypothetical protein VGF55_28105 [Gemmataceae bacterium]